LPAFSNKDGSITFPDSNDGGSWRTCNPHAEMNAFAARNTATNHNLKAIGRMARIWKDQNTIAISGMLIDTLAYNFINGWEHKDKSYLYHDFLVRDFMKYLAECNKTQDWWRAPGSGSWVRRIGSFETKAASAHTMALTAISQEVNGNHWSSVQSWRTIFGTTFPND
ncbi:MAG: hypothetical protein KGJ73_08100, partial [Rhodospirillales bacterium]|nr:hypothetical protein [Rhodospirillales bacterium]